MCLRAKFLTGLVAGILGIGCSGSSTEDAYIEQASVIHQNALTIDGHIEIPANYATREVDPGRDNDFQVDLPKLLAGEIKGIFLVIDPGRTASDTEDIASMQAGTTRGLEAIHRLAEEMHPNEFEIAYSADDIERIVGSGKLAASIGIENGLMIGHEIGHLETYFNLGGRYMALPHEILTLH